MPDPSSSPAGSSGEAARHHNSPSGAIDPGSLRVADEETDFHRGLGLFDATMVVIGGMIGSGIFLVSAEMSRLIASPGWLLVAWLIAAVLTLAAALSYGELAAMMPRAGGQYVYLREAFSPLFGFLYGWTFLLVIQTGTIAAVAVAFARFSGVIIPWIADDNYLLEPIHITQGYAVSLTTVQLVAVLMIALLTITNCRGLSYGRVVQNLFTVAKVGALLALIVLGLTLGWNGAAVARNFGEFWAVRDPQPVDGLLTAAVPFGLFVALAVSQTGSLFAADSWHCATLVAGEVREPRRNLPRAVAYGAVTVMVLYLLANLAYLVALPLESIASAPDDRVATAMLEQIFPGAGVTVMAVAIMISTFGCNNGMILVGARASYAMARDGLFFPQAGRLNAARVPGWGLVLQGCWAALLVLPRTFRDGKYGNLYGDLLDYVISAALLFYILTILGLFRLRLTRPDALRPYRAVGYPIVPALYVVGATIIVAVLLVYRPQTTLPGVVIVLLGIPMYFVWKNRAGGKRWMAVRDHSDSDVANDRRSV
ncbi:MAG: APC family permease [Planctomycetaceae bacterium]|nr:APC family permease [Planctomycetaceae bacterium]